MKKRVQIFIKDEIKKTKTFYICIYSSVNTQDIDKYYNIYSETLNYTAANLLLKDKSSVFALRKKTK